MKITKIAAVMSVILFMLGACSVTESKKMMAKEVVGIGATDCFAAGGTIDSSGGASMCKMKDGSAKPIK